MPGGPLPITSPGPCTVGTCNSATGAVTYGPVAGCAVVPPDPSTLATPVNPTVASDVAAATQFLYSGPSPIQVGVAPATINATRVSVVSGTVLQVAGGGTAALPGVAITVVGHPEYGVTWSRQDGAYDLVVNGGGAVALEFSSAGYIPVQRHVYAPWRDYAHAPDVVMTALDANASAVALGAGAPQVAQGEPGHGRRRYAANDSADSVVHTGRR